MKAVISANTSVTANSLDNQILEPFGYTVNRILSIGSLSGGQS
jgi:hypothetical protein